MKIFIPSFLFLCLIDTISSITQQVKSNKIKGFSSNPERSLPEEKKSKKSGIQSMTKNPLDIPELKLIFKDAAEQQRMYIEESKVDGEYYFSEESGEHFSVSKGDEEVFTVRVKKPEKGERKINIIISNRPTDTKFINFEDSHFEIRMGVDTTKDNPEELAADISSFLMGALITVQEKLEHLDNTFNSGGMIVDILNDLFKGKKITSVDIEQSRDNDLGIIASEISIATPQNPKQRIRFLLAPTFQKIYNFSLVDSKEYFEINFHIHKAREIFESAASIIDSIIAKEIHHAHPISYFMEKLYAIISSKQCKTKAFKANMAHAHHFDFLSIGTGDCQLKGLSISAVGYIINSLDGFHISFDNEYVRQEFIISLDDNFDKNLDGVFSEMLAVDADLLDSIKKNKGKSIETETIEKIHDTISGLAGGGVACEKVTNGGFNCNMTIDKNQYIVVKVLERNGEDDYFQVSLIDPPTVTDANSVGYAHPEIYISKHNGYDQKLRLTKTVKPFFDRISKFKVV